VSPSAIDVAALTDRGRVRPGNEDAVGAFLHASGDAVLVLVADGVGGLKDGAYASSLAVDYARDAFNAASSSFVDVVERALVKASDDLFARSNGDDTRLAGTTVVALILSPGESAILYAGDSRAYRYRDGDLAQLTRDHSWVNEQVDAGLMSEEEAEYSLQRNVITRCLGVEPAVRLDRLVLEEVPPGTTYLLSTDGLHGVLQDAEIASLLKKSRHVKDLCRDLVRRANGAGGPDNVSVAIARVPER
jgi:PPM family protein phosphatase